MQMVQPAAVGVTPQPGTVVVNNPSAPQTLAPLVLAQPLTQTVVPQSPNQGAAMAAILNSLSSLSQAVAAQGAQIMALSTLSRPTPVPVTASLPTTIIIPGINDVPTIPRPLPHVFVSAWAAGPPNLLSINPLAELVSQDVLHYDLLGWRPSNRT